MGLEDRLRAALQHSEDHGEPPTLDALRRRARVRQWRRRRMSVGAAVLVVAVTAGVLVVQQDSPGRSRRVELRPGLVMVGANIQLAASSVRRAAPDPAAIPELVAANSQFAFDLYHELVRESPAANLVLSPESISDALAMTYAGARGSTAAEIGRVLHFDALPADQLNVAFNALSQTLLAARVAQDKGRTALQLLTSNSEWGQRGYPFEQAYLDTLAEYYGTGLRLSDFMHDAEGSRQRINAFVAQQTGGRITGLLPPGVIDGFTRLVLVNTITFTADWRTPFAKQLTTPQPFTRIDGSRVEAPMMAQEEPGGFYGYQGDDFVAARLPYEGGASMLLIVPNAGQFAAVEQRLDPTLVQQIVSGLGPGASVWLPKFDISTEGDLMTPLRALGVHNLSNLTGIAPDADLQVTHVMHETTIHVDEDGTKAAAAAAVVASDQGTALSRFVVRADRPFIYLIRDDSTGDILFVGQILDPTQR